MTTPPRECRNCANFRVPDDWRPAYGKCALAEGGMNAPDRTNPPMYADGNDGYNSWLWVKPDHGCNAWDGPGDWIEEDGDSVWVRREQENP